jgi:hypothetical protein
VLITEEELLTALRSRLGSLEKSQEAVEWDAGYQQAILDLAACFGLAVWEL